MPEHAILKTVLGLKMYQMYFIYVFNQINEISRKIDALHQFDENKRSPH